MSLRETEAIILRSYPLGEADRLVSFFSRSYGRLRGVAKGARRPKSRFGATLECCSHVRLWFYERETRDLVRISQSELAESFLGAFGEMDSGNALNLLAEISEFILPEREPLDASFRLLLVALKAIDRTRKPALPVAYFCLWTMRLAGWLPALDKCLGCGAALQGRAAYRDGSRAGFRCERCGGGGAHLISVAAREAAQRMLTEKLEMLLETRKPCSASALAELTGFLLDGLEHQMERKLTTRTFMEMTA